jgi:hypothetical protein
VERQFVIGGPVEFQTDVCSFGEGIVVFYNEDTDHLQVRDEFGEIWNGTGDLATVIDVDQGDG